MEIRPILSALLGSRSSSKTGAVLVALQVALSLAILVNTLHIVEVRLAVAARPTGVADEQEVFYLQLDNLEAASASQQVALQRSQAATLRAVPGVVSVADVSQAPLSRNGSSNGVSASRQQKQTSAQAALYVTPDALVRTWGLQLLEGRDFKPEEVRQIDRDTSRDFPTTVIVTRALAEKVWPGAASVLGKTLYHGVGAQAQATTVIGVVARLQTQNGQLGQLGEYSMLIPARLTGDPDTLLTARAAPGQRERVMREAEAALLKAAPLPLIVRSKSLEQDRAARYRADRALAWMLVAVSALLLLVTASGIVGIASLWVAQRRKQIGVRRALGARRRDIVRYFLTENLLITSAGIGGGVLLALLLNQLLVRQLELARLPPAYLLAGAMLFWALGLLAAYGPAWRAAAIAPATATRGA